ncbi:DUF6916 family protein [Methylomagnum sp.]
MSYELGAGQTAPIFFQKSPPNQSALSFILNCMLRRTVVLRLAQSLVLLMLLSPATLLLAAASIPLSQSLSHANFLTYKGETFSVYTLSGKGPKVGKVIPLTITEVTPLKQDAKTEQFTVVFKGPLDYPLQKAVYAFERPPRTDTFELFLEPNGSDRKWSYYRALFNLLK